MDFFNIIYSARLGITHVEIGINSDFDKFKRPLSHDVASGSDITPCNKIGKSLAVYRDHTCFFMH